jgi:hypothetical protein
VDSLWPTNRDSAPSSGRQWEKLTQLLLYRKKTQNDHTSLAKKLEITVQQAPWHYVPEVLTHVD